MSAREPAANPLVGLLLGCLLASTLTVQAGGFAARRSAAQPLPTAPPTFEVPTLPPDIPTPVRFTATPTSAFSPTPSATPSPTEEATAEPTEPPPPPSPSATAPEATVTPSPSATPTPPRLMLPRLLRAVAP
jgi:hypothetical protein